MAIDRDDLRNGLRNYWYPILPSAEVRADRPTAVTRLGEELVVWRDGDGRASVLMDRCPHRGVRLSIGDVVDGRLQCRYHGLQFDCSGQCRLVPFEKRDDGPLAKRMHARALPVDERHGAVWAFIGDEEVFPAGQNPVDSEMPELVDPSYVWSVRGLTWSGNWLLMHDNSSDLFHVPFLHGHFAPKAERDGTMSTRRLRDGVPLVTKKMASLLAFQTYKTLRTANGIATRVREGASPETLDETEFVLPCVVKVQVPPPLGSHKLQFIQYEMALDAKRTYALIYVGMKVDSPALRRLAPAFLEQVIWRFGARIFDQDSWIVENQGDADECLANEQLLPTDGGVARLRKLLHDTHAAQQQRIREHRASRAAPADATQSTMAAVDSKAE